MAKTETTYVAQDKFLAIVEELGLETQEQAGFIKVKGPEGHRLYVARTKKVGRVDISGFTCADSVPGVRVLDDDLKFGGVKEQIEFSGRTEDEILETFRGVLEHMMALEPKAKPAPKGKGKDKGALLEAAKRAKEEAEEQIEELQG
jgi:hypothetical protein